MNEEKRNALEAAGWKFGSVHEFLGEPKMNVDEAMEAAAEFKVEMKVRPYWTLFSESVAVVLAAEVERLRAELAETVKTLRRNGWGAE